MNPRKIDIFWFAFWFIITLTIIVGCKQPAEPAPDDPVTNGVTITPRLPTQEEYDLLAAHEKYRIEKNLPLLISNDKLNAAAQYHADWMAANDTMSHIGKNGSTLAQRLKQAGYKYSHAGENIARGYANVDAVMKGWKNSPGHNANMLNKNHRHIGAGIAKSKTGKKYWCVDFGRSAIGLPMAHEISEDHLPGGIEE